jgi:hypothetical protein
MITLPDRHQYQRFHLPAVANIIYPDNVIFSLFSPVSPGGPNNSHRGFIELFLVYTIQDRQQ